MKAEGSNVFVRTLLLRIGFLLLKVEVGTEVSYVYISISVGTCACVFILVPRPLLC